MPTTFAVLFIVIFLLAYWRKKHHQYVALRYKYKLYELRDRLRRGALEGKVDKQDWLFSYFDQTLSKGVANHRYLTYIFILLVVLKHRQESEKVIEMVNALNREVEKNAFLMEISNELDAANLQYIRDQHMISDWLIIKPLLIFSFIFKFYKKTIKNVANMKVYPETSASPEFGMRLC